MHLHEFNPWWKTSRVPEGLLGTRREIFDKILSFFDYRQIIMLFGVRRAGKTTLMYQFQRSQEIGAVWFNPLKLLNRYFSSKRVHYKKSRFQLIDIIGNILF